METLSMFHYPLKWLLASVYYALESSREKGKSGREVTVSMS